MTTMPLEITLESATAQPCVLIADDQTDVLEALRLLLKGHGYQTEAVTSPIALLDAIARREFDLILMDLNYARDTTSGREGLDLLAQLQALGGAPPIVVMTGWATVGLAVEAMQHGVGDFVEKPWVNTRLLEILKRQIELGRGRRENRRRELKQVAHKTKSRSSFTSRKPNSRRPAQSSRVFSRKKFLSSLVSKSPRLGNQLESSAAIITTSFLSAKMPRESALQTWLAKACPRRCSCRTCRPGSAGWPPRNSRPIAFVRA